MSLSRFLAGRIMRAAARRAPPGRSEWALAMEREYDELRAGELSWAIGCLAAVTGWQLRANWLYLVLLAAAPIAEYQLSTRSNWAIITSLPHEEIRPFFKAYGAILALAPQLLVAVAMGWYRPRNVTANMIVAGFFGQHVCGTLYISWFVMHDSPLSWWGPNATLYMAPPLIGLCASLGIWYFGGSMGAALARRTRAA